MRNQGLGWSFCMVDVFWKIHLTLGSHAKGHAKHVMQASRGGTAGSVKTKWLNPPRTSCWAFTQKKVCRGTGKDMIIRRRIGLFAKKGLPLNSSLQMYIIREGCLFTRRVEHSLSVPLIVVLVPGILQPAEPLWHFGLWCVRSYGEATIYMLMTVSIGKLHNTRRYRRFVVGSHCDQYPWGDRSQKAWKQQTVYSQLQKDRSIPPGLTQKHMPPIWVSRILVGVQYGLPAREILV